MAEEPALARGDSGGWVTYLQQMLEYHQVGSGFETGTYCPATEDAVSTVQQHHGLPATGRCDETTWAALTGAAPPATEVGGTDEALPADIAVSLRVQVIAPDEVHTLDELDDLPGNTRRLA